MVSSRDLEYLQIVPSAKELLMNTDIGAPNVTKDIPMQLPSIREQPLAQKASADPGIPRLRDEGKQRSLPSAPNHNMVEPWLQQLTFTPGSSIFQVQGTPRLANSWVRVETDSTLISDDFSAKEDVGSKSLVLQTPASVDGWVCVERPPMTWEDALKIAQKARETAARASSTVSSPLTSLSEHTFNATPVTSQSSGKINNSSQACRGQGAIFSPLPPKQTPSRTSSGCVKARINAFESSAQQDPDLSMSKLENEKVQAGNSPEETAAAAHDQRTARQNLKKWEDMGRNQVPASRISADREQCAEANLDQGKGSSRVNSSRDRIAKDYGSQSSRFDKPASLRDRIAKDYASQSSRFDRPASGGWLDSRITNGNLSMRRESEDTHMAWRLPELHEINVENHLKQSSMAVKDSVSSVKGNLSAVDKKECGNLLNQLNCGLISEESAAMEELGDTKEEKAVSVEPPLPVQEATVKSEDVASQDRKGTPVEPPLPLKAETVKREDAASQGRKVAPEAHLESQHLNKVNEVRRPRSSVASPKPTPLDLQNLPRSGDSQQAWKSLQNSVHPTTKPIPMPAGLNEKSEQKRAYDGRVTSKRMDDHIATSARQVDIIFKAKSITELDNKIIPPVRTMSCEDNFHTNGEDSSANDSKILGHLGSGLKQVVSGAVILAGLFALWPKNGGPVARYHVVKAGETLNSIAPGQCTDPSSTFCRINPRVCDQKAIYPGQRIRLS
ncbi:unnamed protein product [Calypogeia fissa]